MRVCLYVQVCFFGSSCQESVGGGWESNLSPGDKTLEECISSAGLGSSINVTVVGVSSQHLSRLWRWNMFGDQWCS